MLLPTIIKRLSLPFTNHYSKLIKHIHFSMMRMRSPPLIIMFFSIWVVTVTVAAEGPRILTVGDSFGWRVPLQNDTAVYSHWASTNRFHIGDSLSFVYDKDSVMEVDKWGFYHCNASDPITAFDNGNSTFELDRPGLFYFISGSNAHCTNGQRLIVQVMHIHHHDHQRNASMPPSMSPLSASPSASDSASTSASTASSLLASLFPPFAAFLLLPTIA